MTTATLSLSFSVDKSDTFGTLEMVCACARRGGLRLSGMTLHEGVPSDIVCMTLRAAEQDLLDLFVLRLSNLIDVGNIHCLPSVSTSFTSTIINPSTTNLSA